MLQKENRLTGKDDFQKIHSKGRFYGDEFLAIRVFSSDFDIVRLGFLVGLKVSKKAVVRNKIKRRLREIFSSLIKKNKLKKGFDIVVLVRPMIVDKHYNEIEKAIRRVLAKADLMK